MKDPYLSLKRKMRQKVTLTQREIEIIQDALYWIKETNYDNLDKKELKQRSTEIKEIERKLAV